MPKSKKRAHAVIDLTEDESRGNDAKRPALTSTPASHLNSNTSFPSSTGLGGSHVYSHSFVPPPRQSAPKSSSQHTSNSQASVREPDVLDLTQEDEGPGVEFYGKLDAKIVGIRYYNGYASRGEVVLCRREPNNQYDSNAIRVDNVMYQQIGHLPRKVVEKIAPYVDRGDIVLEAQLSGEKGYYDCPVALALYGPSHPTERARVEEALKGDKLIKATQLKQTKNEAETRRAVMGLTNGGSTAGFASDGSPDQQKEVTLDDILQSSESVDMRKGGDAIRALAVSEETLAKMPMAEQPAELKSQLLPYQLQGLAWMTAKESPALPAQGSDDAVQLWKRDGRGRYWNVASGFVKSSPPQLISGGILADDMGLGKTLQVISLILTGGPGPTLIVAPVSVMSNWDQQMRQHVHPDRLPKVLLYHGDTKAIGTKDLMNSDVVITSYGKLAREREEGVGKVLLNDKVKWRRVVLDEGHTIRNAKTKVALAASELKSTSRWVLTGTPIINSVKDLQSIVKFLQITGGIEQPEVFNTQITRKLATGDRSAEILLQALMQDVCLRRKKDMKFVDLKLPEKKEYIHRISFRPDEKRKYDSLLSEARGILEEIQAKSSAGQKGRFQTVLERLLRLRQTCNHWTLCRQRIDDLLKLLEDQNVVAFTDENRTLLQEALRLYIESQEECAVCYEPPTGPVITNCKHVFCRECIAKAIHIQHKCPMCRNALSEDCLLEPAVEGADDAEFDAETQSSKTDAMMQIVKATIKKPGSKLVIFSQWTSFLNIVQSQLGVAGVKYTRIDGSMTADRRDRAIRDLEEDPDTVVLLASLAVCSVGLNLVSADTVILSDSWWAPAIEDQAIDRVHRLGQKRETTVWRLVMEGSVEERVLDIQQEKRELVNKAFQEKDGRRKKTKDTRMADVMKLLS